MPAAASSLRAGLTSYLGASREARPTAQVEPTDAPAAMSRQRSLGGLDGADGMPEEQATVESTPEEESEQAPKSFSVEKTDSRARRDFLASASCDDENATADDTVAPETNALSALPPSNTPPVLPGREACASRPADLLRGVSDNIFQDGGSLMPSGR